MDPDKQLTRRRGVPVAREHIEEAARLYRDAIAVGQPPRPYVSHQMNVPEPTVAKWIMRARRPGPHGEPPLLGPAMRGRAGEQKDFWEDRRRQYQDTIFAFTGRRATPQEIYDCFRENTTLGLLSHRLARAEEFAGSPMDKKYREIAGLNE